MPSSVTLDVTPNIAKNAVSPTQVNSNLVTAVLNHDTSRRETPQDQLGVKTLGKNTGLVLQELQQGLLALENLLRNPQQTTITAAQIQSLLPSGNTQILEVPLTTSTTNISQASATTEGVALIVFIYQDATGGRQITWDPNFRYTTVNIVTTAHTTSVFNYISRQDPTAGTIQWYLTALPITGAV